MYQVAGGENNLEERFFSFCTVYKYITGEYSAYSPFSRVAFTPENFDFDYIHAKAEYSLYMYYAQSKLANLLFGYKLSRVLKDSGITANILCPGLIDTNLNPQRPKHIVDRALPVEQGIISTMHLVTAPELKGVTGKFYSSVGAETQSSPASYNLDDQEKLWTLSEKLTDEKFCL